jgi:myo-inositol-1(or 4)-monophosphatase
MLSSNDLLRLGTAAARAGAEFLRTVPRPAREAWETKGTNDFVTEVDRRAEEIIAAVLLAGEPGATVVGEELAPDPDRARRGLAWVVDPLDGTTNFLHDYPQWGVSLAGAVDGVLQAGVVFDVPRDLCYVAARGHGAWLGDRRLAVSAVGEPGVALIGTGFPFKHPQHLPRWVEHFRTVARESSGVRRAGSAALDLADVAAGRFDGFWELQLAPWDYAAGQLLVEEAGGVLTDLEGKDPGLTHAGIVAGNPAIHDWLLKVVNGA